jgi:hypothetical protein
MKSLSSGSDDDVFSSVNIDCGGDPTDTTCLIGMQILQEEPYNLIPGQVVVARVAAKNVHGMGDYLEAESDVSIQSVPATMATPGIEPLGGSDDRVKITWQPL